MESVHTYIVIVISSTKINFNEVRGEKVYINDLC